MSNLNVTAPGLLRLIGGTLGGLSATLCFPAELPTACVAGSCGAGAPLTWVSSGAASLVQADSQLTITQTSPSATLNWKSFNIGADGSVVFKQPDSASVALNRIFQADPSRIFGSLQSNGRVYLLNQNGFIFGQSAKVETGALLASSLNISQQALQNGIARAASDAAPAFLPYTNAQGQDLASGAITVEKGARLASASGQVLLFAPEVTNRGEISTPDGQTILAAGKRVFIVASTDSNLRGLLVEVGDGGTVTNGEAQNADRAAADIAGRISADRGNVTLAGLAVNQLGRVSASTTVRANGSIRLQARDTTDRTLQLADRLQTSRGGDLTFGRNSITEAPLAATDAEKSVDVNLQPESSVYGSGARIGVLANARITAPSGSIELAASTLPSVEPSRYSSTPDASRLFIDNGAVLDASGAQSTLPVSRNVVRVELRGSQLQDSPVQRDGALRSEAVFVDVRQSGVRDDGTSWQGSPIGNLGGDISNIQRDVSERNLDGGSITLTSQGAMYVARDASLDVSGGRIDWQGGYVNTTKLLGEDGKVYDISSADRDRTYTGIVDSLSVTDDRWGVTREFVLPGGGSRGVFEAGYTEGRNAGTVSLLAPRTVLDGSILGRTIAGKYQLQPNAAGAVLYNQVPLGAKLVLGNASRPLNGSFVATDILFDNGFTLAPFGAGTTSTFNPLVDPIPAAANVLRIRGNLLSADQVSRIAAYADGTAWVLPTTAINLPAGGEFSVSAGRILVEGGIDAPSGSITLAATSTTLFSGATRTVAPLLSIAEGVHLGARGEWVNNNIDLAGGRLSPLWVDGGRIALSSDTGDLLLGNGSVLDVSAGAWRGSGGAIVGGRGGSISLLSRPGNALLPTYLRLGSELRGYALSRGGSLSVTANGFCVALQPCATSANIVELMPQWFSGGGFSSISLATNLAGLNVAPGSVLSLRQRNYVLDSDLARIASRADFNSLARIDVLPDHLRGATNLSLTATTGRVAEAPADLVLGAGSVIDGDPGARIALASDSSLVLDGRVSAPAGSISATLESTSRLSNYNSAIWLGFNSSFDVSGRLLSTPSGLGLRTGDVLSGGTISLNAKRGYIMAQPGSVLASNGSSSTLDIVNSAGQYTPHTIGSNGGRISLTAAEGMRLGGKIEALSGAGDGSAGGTLALTFDTSARNDRDGGFPIGDRRIVLTNDAAPVVMAGGQAVSDFLNGQAVLDTDTVRAGGFASLELTARNLFTVDPLTTDTVLAGYGEIAVDPGVNLQMRSNLKLDTATVSMTGAGAASLAGNYVSLGSSDLNSQESPAAAAGAGELTLSGRFVDVLGRVTATRLGGLRIASEGDLRLRGVSDLLTGAYAGRLDIAAPLRLSATQIYPSTLTAFAINSTGPLGRIEIERAPGTPDDVLSAGGRLTLNSPVIVNNGALRAPLGELTLRGDRISVGSTGSLSTSLQGLTVPFGNTQGGLSWTYQDDVLTRVYGTDGGVLPAQRVRLEAADVSLASGSTVDLGGGGDLLAYEFLPGPNGSRDVLSAALRPNQFAVVPGLRATFAPYDPREYSGSSLKPGDQVHLEGGNGLAAGTYTLLPARYALLPGAFVVSSVTGYRDLPADSQISRLNGAVIVSGYRSVAGTGIRDARASGFSIRTAASVRAEAQYATTSANTFFAAQADVAQQPRPRLPGDAGTAVFAASQSLVLDGVLKAAAAPQYRGASVDVASNRIRVGAAGTPQASGYLNLSAERLSSLGVESLVIGGSRSVEGSNLAAVASEVVVGQDATLTGPEVMLVARDTVTVESGAKITATGNKAQSSGRLNLDSDSALLRVSTGEQVTTSRSGGSSGGQGRLVLANGSTVATRGSVTIDVSKTAQTDGALDFDGASFAIGAPRLALGDSPAGYAGITFDPAATGGSRLAELVLRSRQATDFFGDVALSTRRLVIDSPLLQAAGAAPVRATLRADEMVLRSSTVVPGATAANGSASLTLDAGSIQLGEGTMATSGFSTTSVNASSDITATGSGQLRASGAVAMSAGLLTVANGQSYGITSSGSLDYRAAPGTPTVTESLGGRLGLSGSSVTVAGRISAPAGQVDLLATQGDVHLTGTAVIDAGGRTRQFDGVAVDADAGAVTLTARQGSVLADTGSRIDLRATGEGASGSLLLRAAQGQVVTRGELLASAARAHNGGRATVEAAALDFDSLAARLASGGFTGAWDIWNHGAGNFVIASGTTLKSTDVRLTADGGGILVAGTIDAAAPRGGSVVLSAAGGITVSGAIDARATDANVRGGRVELDSATAVIAGAQSSINVGGTTLSDPAQRPGGSVDIRLPQDAVLSAVNSPQNARLALGGSITGAREVVVEGVAQYTDADGSIDFNDTLGDSSNPIFADAEAFAARADEVLTALGRRTDPAFAVRAGVEITSPGDLALDSTWDLSTWRFNGQPGVLTLRAGGNLLVNESLSDGFPVLDPDVGGLWNFLIDGAGPSWSYRLAAGSRLDSANPLATRFGATTGGDLRIAPGTAGTVLARGDLRMVRTGTGRIDVAAARDIVFGNQASVIYTAGEAGPGVPVTNGIDSFGLDSLAYPVNGGDIRIAAGRDVVGAPTAQLFTDWQVRSGARLRGTATAWTIAFDRFEQGVGALGGGQLSISAGRDVLNLSASTPSVGRLLSGRLPVDSVVQASAGGDLSVLAGGNIVGGKYYVDRGLGTLRAGDAVLASTANRINYSMGPVLALGDSTFAVTARNSVNVSALINPTLIPGSPLVSENTTIFGTYAPTSGARLQAVGGSLNYAMNSQTYAAAFGNYPIGLQSTLPLQVAPPSLRGVSLSSDVTISGPVNMWPAPRGNLELFARNDVRLLSDNVARANIVMSDSLLGSQFLSINNTDINTLQLTELFRPASTLFNAPAPVHGATAGRTADPTTARIVALEGDVFSAAAGTANPGGSVFVPKPLRIVAGGSIRNVGVRVQHNTASDVSSLVAGEDLIFTSGRNQFGNLTVNGEEIAVDGPGRLEILAGRNVDLQTSGGVTSRGNLRNPALPTVGASVSITAGLNGREPAHDAMIAKYIEGGTRYDTALIAFVQSVSGASGLSKAQALARLRSLPRSAQRPFLEAVLFAEIRAGGREAAQSTAASGDFTRAFTALTTYFPGSNPDTQAGQANAYSGDIRLYFSRVYTLSGGDINLMAPGGEVNVGLATPPTAFGVTKTASELGVVAQSTGTVNSLSFADFMVNESRVFAADGGDILVWTTNGDIDAGRGAKTAISAPPPVITVDSSGKLTVSFPAALTGSGIQTLASTAGRRPGNVDLFAPRGVVNAGDAGIVAGNLTIAATAVLGANNISVSGTSVGVPVDTGGLGASLAAASSSSAAASNSSQNTLASGDQEKTRAPIAAATLGWLDVFVEGFGEEVCKPNDQECLRRNQQTP